jgi:hypothetical protein
MADNVGITPGSGATAAADDIGGVLHQRVKLTLGADGVSDGDVSSSNPIPAQLTTVTSENPLPTQETGGAMSLLSRILNVLLSPMGFDRSLSRQRVTGIIESGTVTTVSTVTTVTTATTVGTVTNLGAGRTGIELQDNANRFAWAQCVRSRIT